MKRYAAIAYFIILFAILGSYLAWSIPDDSVRLHVATSNQLSMQEENLVHVWARDLNTGSIFSGYSLEARWIQADLTQVPNTESLRTTLPIDGDAIIKTPMVPEVPTAGLEIILRDAQEKVQKRAVVPANVFQTEPITVHTEPAQSEDGRIYLSMSPAAFMFNEPNDVYLMTFGADKTYEGKIDIEQIYGQKAEFPESITTKGLTRIPITIHAPADFKFTAGEQNFYTSILPNEKPFHAVLKTDPVLEPTKIDELSKHTIPSNIVARVTPFGTEPTLTIDYFVEDAWVSRQTVAPQNIGSFKLDPNFKGQPGTYSILYARISHTTVGSADSSQTFALIVDATPDKKIFKSKEAQASFAVQQLKAMYSADSPEVEMLSKYLKTHPRQANIVRDYALSRIAEHHAPSIEMRIKTETADNQKFESEKSTQKSIANVILVSWFGLGFLVSLIWIIQSSRKRKEQWAAIMASGDVESGQLPSQTSGIQLLVLVILFIGLMVSLFYMMQIV